MLSEIIFSFFAAFGILQTILLLWHLLCRPAHVKNAVIVYAPDPAAEDVAYTVRTLKKTGLPLLVPRTDDAAPFAERLQLPLFEEAQLYERINRLWKS